MNTDVERWRFPGAGNSMFKGVAIGHQSGGGENAVAVRLDDAFVYVAGEAEIIRVKNDSGCRGHPIKRWGHPFRTRPGEWS